MELSTDSANRDATKAGPRRHPTHARNRPHSCRTSVRTGDDIRILSVPVWWSGQPRTRSTWSGC